MQTIDSLATRAVLDALAMAGPDDSGYGYIRTAAPSDYLTGQRLVLAREALVVIGRRRAESAADIAPLVAAFKPRLRELVLSGEVTTSTLTS